MISICIATYNGERYVRQQLESILPQLSVEDEVVVSDDGSTDGTLDILSSFNDSRIRVFCHQRRKEAAVWDYVTHNFENAITHTQGDFLFLSDQDDIFLPNKIEKMYDVLNNGATLAICDCRICDADLNILRSSMFDECVTRTYIDAFLHFRMLGCCMAFRRELLAKALPFPRTKVGHDLWLFLMAKHYGSIIYINEQLHLYRRHETTVTTAGGISNYSVWFRLYYRLFVVCSFLIRILKLKKLKYCANEDNFTHL